MKIKDLNKESPVCSECAEAEAYVPKGIAGFWQDICAICHEKKICSAMRDWKR